MASCYLVLALRIEGRAAVDLKNQITTSAIGNNGDAYAQRFVKMAQNELKACAGGVRQGNLWGAVLDSTAALPTGNIACVQANAAGDTVTFTYGGVPIVLTEGVDFARGATNTTLAAALAAAINAHPVLGKLFTALGAVGNCGLVGKVPTALLHDITITTNDGTAFSFTQLNGGTEGVAQFFLQHFTLNRAP
jgi:hypothetical protein